MSPPKHASIPIGEVLQDIQFCFKERIMHLEHTLGFDCEGVCNIEHVNNMNKSTLEQYGVPDQVIPVLQGAVRALVNHRRRAQGENL
jgi:hypothetical protein